MRHIAQLHSVTPEDEGDMGGQQELRSLVPSLNVRKKKVLFLKSHHRREVKSSSILVHTRYEHAVHQRKRRAERISLGRNEYFFFVK